MSTRRLPKRSLSQPAADRAEDTSEEQAAGGHLRLYFAEAELIAEKNDGAVNDGNVETEKQTRHRGCHGDQVDKNGAPPIEGV